MSKVYMATQEDLERFAISSGLSREAYHFRINQDESDPANKIQYLDANASYTPAKMNFATGQFDYGSWANAFFIKGLRPCMLKYDGTVDYDLNPNDYSKKLNGGNSDIANESYAGNAVVGIPKTYWKNATNGNLVDVHIANYQVDADYKCYAHIDYNSVIQDYLYMGIYNGYKDAYGRMRSLSGKTPTVSLTRDAEITACVANNIDIALKRWYTETYSAWELIALLTMLIGKNTDSQAIFGNGVCSAPAAINTGTMDNKGLFWGSNSTTEGVKMFGIEHPWGNLWMSIAGFMNNKYKMCWGTSDGTTVKDYNTTGDGYIATNCNVGTNYIKTMKFDSQAMIPSTPGGSATTYYCDHTWAGSGYALVGGGWCCSADCGSCCLYLRNGVSNTNAYIGSRALFI